jgi:RNA polymerase sigma-70 factor (ECF subfamily)
MLSIAYRMVGSFSEAEDLVQEAFLRFHEAGEVKSPKAWLTTVLTRLCIDHLRSARVRREEYPGPWLPEPVLADPSPDAAVRSESLSMAVLVLLESLTPVERAVFVLHDVFDYSYDEISEIVDKTPENCRQLAARARRHVDERRPRFEPSREQREELARRFIAALHEGETEGLVELLAADAAFYGDGGGKAAAVGLLEGRDRIAAVLAGFGRVAERRGATIQFAEINGQPGVLGFENGALVAAWALQISGGAIQAIHGVVNPDKLAHISKTILPSLPPPLKRS